MIFLGRAPEFFDLRYKIGADIDHVAKFNGDRSSEILWRIKINK